MNRWLSFREIKQSIPIEAVLGHYQWKYLRRRGDRVQGCCPIHRGQRTDAFNVDLRNNGFNCFSCQAHGGVLDLVVAMERCSLRQAGILLTEWFTVTTEVRTLESTLDHKKTAQLIREKERLAAPLKFTLRPVDSRHAYLQERGIDADTAAHFGVGYYAARDYFKGVWSFPSITNAVTCWRMQVDPSMALIRNTNCRPTLQNLASCSIYIVRSPTASKR